jgi:TRAP-type C4-dicarboxylate transport system permease small subunit
MNNAGPVVPGEATPGAPPPTGTLQRITGAVAVFGGFLALAVALLATTSVLGRWLFSKPIEGDFEFVKMATAVAIFAYLPYAQARRANITVDTFTSWLPRGVNCLLDAVWDLVYALVMGAIAVALAFGTLDSFRSGETTMQLQIMLWPSIALSMLLCVLLTVTALVTMWQLSRSGVGGTP